MQMEIVTFVLSLISAFLIAKWFGDKAGTEAAIKYEEHKLAKARITALVALTNEVEMIQTFADHNSKIEIKLDNIFRQVLKMPTNAIEVAFLSGNSYLVDDSAVDLSLVTRYLAKAHFINNLIQLYSDLATELGVAAMGQKHDVITQICSESGQVLNILTELKRYLDKELENAKLRLGKDQK